MTLKSRKIIYYGEAVQTGLSRISAICIQVHVQLLNQHLAAEVIVVEW